MADGVRHRAGINDAESKEELPAAPRRNRFNSHKFNSRRTLAKSMLDVALLSNNLSSLKQLLKHQDTEREHALFEWMVGGVVISIILQVVIAFFLIVIGQKDVEKEEDQDSAMQWNDVLTGLVLVQTVVNVTVTQFMDF